MHQFNNYSEIKPAMVEQLLFGNDKYVCFESSDIKNGIIFFKMQKDYINALYAKPKSSRSLLAKKRTQDIYPSNIGNEEFIKTLFHKPEVEFKLQKNPEIVLKTNEDRNKLEIYHRGKLYGVFE